MLITYKWLVEQKAEYMRGIQIALSLTFSTQSRSLSMHSNPELQWSSGSMPDCSA